VRFSAPGFCGGAFFNMLHQEPVSGKKAAQDVQNLEKY